jgi:hypothetical protein
VTFNLDEALRNTDDYRAAFQQAMSDNGHGHEAEAGEPWPAPESLIREMPPAEPFPMEALGSVPGGAAQACQEVIQAPDAVCAQNVLGGTSLAVQAHADIEIDGRVFPLSEDFITVALSGERKTAADKVALSPHMKRQQDLQRQYATEIAEHEIAQSAWKKVRDDVLNNKKYATPTAKQQAILELGPEPQGPVNAILMVSEPTSEGLTKALEYGWPSVGLFSDEAGQFLGGHAMNKDNLLKTSAALSKMWDGTPITRTRSGDGNRILYGRRVSIHLMVQPEVSALFFGNTLLAAQGLPSRCLVAQPESRIGYQPYKEININDHPYIRRYFARLLSILEEPLPLAEGTRNELAPRRIALAPAAKQVWIGFHDHIQTLMRPEQPLAPIRGLAAKAAEHAARLAGILALVDDFAASTISKPQIEAGIELAQFYLNEALRLFNSAAINPDLLLAEKLLAWARARGGLLYLQPVYQLGPNQIRDKAVAHQTIGILEQHGWVRRLQQGAVIDGAHRKEVWEVHP